MLNLSPSYTANELASVLACTRQAIDLRSKREGWQALPRSGRGGGSLWIVSSMPAETRDLIASSMLRRKRECGGAAPVSPAGALVVKAENRKLCKNTENTPDFDVKTPVFTEPVPSIPQKPVTVNVAISRASDRERSVALARLAFVREVEALAPMVGKEGAVRHLLEAAERNELSPALAQCLKTANACLRKGQGSALSRRSLYRWCAGYANGGEAALLPGSRRPGGVPDWAEDFLKFYARPQNPTVALAHKDFCSALEAEGCTDFPSIFACRRLLQRMSIPEREAGRATGNALLKLRPHKRRSTDELWPTDVYTADGTTFDAEILHPGNGQAWKPEITAVFDVATRRCVGLSVALAENALTILDGLRMACCFGGIPAMFYSDNGPGYVNKIMQDDRTGMFPRLGIEFTSAIPGRPQGKGLMERAVKTLWVEAAQGLVSYTGAYMDEDAAHRQFKLSRKQLAAGKGGRKKNLPTWQEFKAHILRRVEEYNATPHRSLPLFTDAEGRRRHFSPEEYWQSFVTRGFIPVMVPAGMKDELFMPAERRKTSNGWLRFYGGRYYAPELAEFHQQYVEIRYDTWDESKVYAWTLDGRKICTAVLEGNTIPYFPKSRVEAARDRREQARVKRLDAKLQRIVPGAEIVLPEEPGRLSLADTTAPRVIQPMEAQSGNNISSPVPDAGNMDGERDTRPVLFVSTYERYVWLMRHQSGQTEQDKAWLAEYATGEEYADMADLYEVQGIAYRRQL